MPLSSPRSPSSPVESSEKSSLNHRPGSRRRESVAGMNGGLDKPELHYIGFDHPPSDLVQQIVHPLFSSMTEPEAKRNRRNARGANSKPPPQRQNAKSAKRGVDTAAAIVELGKDFAELILQKSVLKKTMKSARGLPVEMILAGLSLGFFIAGVERAPHIELKHMPDIDPGELFHTWHSWKHFAKSSQPLRPVPRGDNFEFDWIHEDDSPKSRLERLAAAARTLQHGYSLLRRQYGMPSKSRLLEGTELIEDVRDQRVGNGLPIQIELAQGDALNIAIEETQKGSKVAVLIEASANHVGNGFLSGGPHQHDSEEAVCMQSTLFFSLQKAALSAEEEGLRDARGTRVNIPERGAVWSPMVEVFRSGIETGYAPMQKTVDIGAVISLSMPNHNPREKGTFFLKTNADKYDKLIEDKFQAALTAAARGGLRVVVVSSIGCRESKNSPEDVGRAFGRALARFNGFFDTAFVVSSKDMCDAARDCYEATAPSSDFAVAKESVKEALRTNFFEPMKTLPFKMFETLTSPANTEEKKLRDQSPWATQRENTMRSEMTRQLGIELKAYAAQQASEASKESDMRLAQILEKHGMPGSKKVPSAKLNEVLKEWYNGWMPPYEELLFIRRSSSAKAQDRLVPAREIVESVRAYELYQMFKKDIELAFYLYDADGTGQLKESEIVHVLHELSGESFSLDQVTAIMKHADINYDGTISRLEFAMMVVRWQSMMANYYSEEPLVLPINHFPWIRSKAAVKACDDLCVACGPAQRQYSVAPIISQEPLDPNSDFRRQFML